MTKLKPHRKRNGLTQEELAFLVGENKRSAISRYETGDRSPDLETAFAYQILFGGELLHDLFPSLYWKVHAQVIERAKALAERIRQDVVSRADAYKVEQLQRIADEEGNVAPAV